MSVRAKICRYNLTQASSRVCMLACASTVLTSLLGMQKTLAGGQWRTAAGATLQGLALRPGGVPALLLAAGSRQAHLITHQCEVKTSLALAVRLR